MLKKKPSNGVLIYIYIKDNNYIWAKVRRATSCAAKPFCIAKPNHWKTTFTDLDDTILLCMILWIFFKMSTTSGARKSFGNICIYMQKAGV
jgi:hypothetical protein